jgi:molybdopterin converting factor small subunit
MGKLTESQVRQIRSGKLSGAELAEKFGVTQTTISLAKTGKTYSHLNSLYPPIIYGPSRRRRLTDAQVRRIRESDKPLAHWADKYGMSIAMISSIRNGRVYRDVDSDSEHRGRLTKADIRKIRHGRNSHRPPAWWAEKLNVSAHAVYMAKNYKTYADQP